MRSPIRFAYVVVSVVVTMLLVTSTVLADAGTNQWLMAGYNLQNTRYNNNETKIGVANVGTLAPLWTFTTSGDVSATPSVTSQAVYFPDFAGNLYALDRSSGTVIWSHKISDYTGVSGDFARDTPLVSGNLLIFGDQGGRLGAGARLIAVKKNTGELAWVTKVDDTPYAIATESAVRIDAQGSATVYVGVASYEEVLAPFIPNYNCCTFRGSAMAVNANNGQIIWKTYTVPTGYSGGSVWGSTPVVDPSRNTVFIDTGNNYSVPPEVETCVANAAGNAAAVQACISPDDHFDAVMALDLSTGAIKWSTAAIPYDAWNVGCIFGNSSTCPAPAGPDYDFGQGPALFMVNGQQILGAGQKSGQYWAFNPDTGQVLWETQVGPGGTLGGLEWGSATDGSRIYVAVANSGNQPWNLINNGQPTGNSIISGFWSALDSATGKILWQTPDPGGSLATGAVSAANGVVYACSMDSVGHMYAMNSLTGTILWSFPSGGSCSSGAAISSGVVFWGSGYSTFGTGNNKFYAFVIH